jgi:YesN/AraC family two-component response regulator
MIRVIIIEDEVNSAKHCASYISAYGHQFAVTAICNNVSEARENFNRLIPEVIFCDIRLGRDNGLDLIREFKNSGWNGYTVLMSGYKDFNYAREAIRIGVEDYLPKPIFPEDIEKTLKSISGKIEKSHSGIEGELIKGLRNNFPPFIDRALEYVALNYVGQITLTDVAGYACVSAAYLCAGFKKYTGFTFIEYLNTYRIEVAKNMLVETNHLLEKIAFQIGINDVIYFNKLFKRFTGLSPGKYRKIKSQD